MTEPCGACGDFHDCEKRARPGWPVAIIHHSACRIGIREHVLGAAWGMAVFAYNRQNGKRREKELERARLQLHMFFIVANAFTAGL